MATSRPGPASSTYGVERFEGPRDALFVPDRGGDGMDVFGGSTTGSAFHALCIGERGR